MKGQKSVQQRYNKVQNEYDPGMFWILRLENWLSKQGVRIKSSCR